MKISHTSLVIALTLASPSLFANQWVAVDCAGQARALLEQASADSQLELTAQQAERLRAISIAVCEGTTPAQGEVSKKKKGLFGVFSQAEEGKKKKGHDRLDRF